MTNKKRDAGNLKLLGGRLCLDFINTLDWRGTDKPQEFLNRYADLILWSRHVGIATREDSQQLSQMAEQSQADALRVLSRAVTLREIIFRIFSAVIQNKKPSGKDMADFNKYFSQSMKTSQIIWSENRFIWDTTGNKKELDWLLKPIIRSAADLLLSEDLGKIKACADPACGWLFIDVSRNRSRRWCDMKDCGNRAKVNRFYRKKRVRE